ncbi:MAG: 16S rRNA (cytosine(967)-C(5))-methyltransferase RsmB [Myxococcales bacterium]|nr:16S rRNA (cytosine(967)-C(5))-methyltransferase RsmB [Myxococcales bacterium]
MTTPISEPPKGARAVAHDVLMAVDAREAYLQPALEAAAQRSALTPRDRGLTLELSSGTLRHVRKLDTLLDGCIARGLASTQNELRWILRVGAYQLISMDRIPARAAIHEAVELARTRLNDGAARFVNGVLRGVQRQIAAREWKPEALTPAVLHSQPDWLYEQLVATLGEEEALLAAAAVNLPAELTVRTTMADADFVNMLDQSGISGQKARFVPKAWHVSHDTLFRTEAFTRGDFFVQDEAAQLVVHLLDTQRGDNLWDVCAAPGGKSRHILETLAGTGKLLATDDHAGKVARLKDTLSRHENVEVERHDGRTPRNATFDRVLLDAPCSALGTLRRHPEIKWRRRPEDIPLMAAQQQTLLLSVCEAVRPGGVLIYAVCTTTEAEGPEQVRAFLDLRPDFERRPPPEGSIDWKELLDANGDMRVWPHRHGMDGFFAAALRRRD